MATLIKGLLAHNLDWQFVMVGVALAATVELCGVGSLSFAVGAYLPLSTTTPDLRRRRRPRVRRPGAPQGGRRRGRTRTTSSAPATCSRPAWSRAARSRASSSRC